MMSEAVSWGRVCGWVDHHIVSPSIHTPGALTISPAVAVPTALVSSRFLPPGMKSQRRLFVSPLWQPHSYKLIIALLALDSFSSTVTHNNWRGHATVSTHLLKDFSRVSFRFGNHEIQFFSNAGFWMCAFVLWKEHEINKWLNLWMICLLESPLLNEWNLNEFKVITLQSHLA